VSSVLPIEIPGWVPPRGYANGVVAPGGRIVATAGQVGWNPVTGEFESDDFAAQAAQALRNVVAVLRAGGAEPAQLIRLNWYVTDRDEYAAARPFVGAAYRTIVGPHYPAMSLLVVTGLVAPRAKVEIEGTAVIGT
jgi:enamine deaminase RidA (YjgF/YER057c/UK114 family)